MNTNDKKLKELEIAQREISEMQNRIADQIAELRAIENKPLYWTDLPKGAYFRFIKRTRLLNLWLKIENGEVVYLANDCMEGSRYNAKDYFFGGNQPVTRVNFDGTQYKGDPRK